MSKRAYLARILRKRNRHWSYGVWNIWNISNTQVLKLFHKDLEEYRRELQQVQ